MFSSLERAPEVPQRFKTQLNDSFSCEMQYSNGLTVIFIANSSFELPRIYNDVETLSQ